MLGLEKSCVLLIVVLTTLIVGICFVYPSEAFTPSANITNFSPVLDSSSKTSLPIANSFISLGSSFPDNKNFFMPSKLYVYSNTTVVWTNNDTTLHTVTSGNPYSETTKQFDSSYLEPNHKFNHTFTQVGDFEYYCILHPFMTGEIIVSKQANLRFTVLSPENLPTYSNVTIVNGSSFPNNLKFFVPAEINIASNGTVRWTNDDTIIHTVTSGKPRQGPTGEFDSGILQSGRSFNHTFTKAGIFDYYSSLHPYMIGKVIVGFSSYNVQSDGSVHPINFLITGNGSQIQQISLRPNKTNLEISMSSISPGYITIVIPRAVLDKIDQNGKDEQFLVMGSKPIEFREISNTPDSRTLEIKFDAGLNSIQIVGSSALKSIVKPDTPQLTAQNDTFQREVSLVIPKGASEHGNLPFEPSTLNVSIGDIITVANRDLVPHSVTSGMGPQDTASGKFFDTSIIEAGKSSDIPTSKLAPREYDFFCIIHPFMKGKLQVANNSMLSAEPNKIGTELIRPGGLVNNASKQQPTSLPPPSPPPIPQQPTSLPPPNPPPIPQQPRTNTERTIGVLGDGMSPTIKIEPGSSEPAIVKAYMPDPATIPTGTTVTWKNEDDTLHTVTSGIPGSAPGLASGLEFDSGYLEAGGTFQHRFDSAGTFNYWCTLHPHMIGKVIVH